MRNVLAAFPKISIVTPSFNQGRFLEKTILSVIEQDYPNLEYIIIDGGSTDESVAIIKKYEQHLAYWVSEPDRGQSHAINKGFKRATGEIFGWLNSDDRYHPRALQAVAEAFTVNPEAGAVVGAGEMYFEETESSMLFEPYPLTLKTLYQTLHKHIMQPSFFFTNNAWRDCGPLDENLHLAMDLDIWLRIAKQYVITTIKQNLSISLVHKSAKTTAFAAQSYADGILIINKHEGEVEAREELIKFIDELLVKRKEIIFLQSELQYLQNELYHSIRTRKEFIKRFSDESENLAALNAALFGSLSWKITQPIRICIDLISATFRKIILFKRLL